MSKNITIALLASAGFAFAGDFYETPAPYSPPVSQPSFGGGAGLFIGGGVDYLFNSQSNGVELGDVLYTGHIGYDFGNNSSVYLESGWLGGNDDVGLGLGLGSSAFFSIDSQT